MLAKAAKDARVRAEAIALQAGSEVGGLKRVNTGVFQITVPNSTKVSSWGSYDTSTIKKDAVKKGIPLTWDIPDGMD